MMNIMLNEQLQNLYANYMVIRPVPKSKDYTYKAGDLIVTVAADQRNHGKTTAGD